jgi:hypothetical protein
MKSLERPDPVGSACLWPQFRTALDLTMPLSTKVKIFHQVVLQRSRFFQQRLQIVLGRYKIIQARRYVNKIRPVFLADAPSASKQ